MPSRSQHFGLRPPLADHSHLKLHHAEGPFANFNPTRAHFTFSTPASSTAEETDETPKDEISTDKNKQASPHPGIQFLWRSRDNRKGRHRLLIDLSKHHDTKAPRASKHPKSVFQTTLRTFTYFPVWDISWLVAFIFTMGSVVWVINGFFSWLPLVAPSTEFQGEGYYGGGVTAFVGAILFFETGSLLLILEAINANREGCFGWAAEQALEGNRSHHKLVHDKSKCRHHHQNKPSFVGKTEPCEEAKQQWQWYPTWRDVREHYMYDLGFLAGAAQLFGATVFGTAGFTALPGIMNHLQPQWRLNAAYWIPQVIGGSGFIVSSTLYMLETQQRWWKPAFGVLGWHVSFWNLIGAYGFTLCGALGMAYGNSGAQYQAALATFWGSWAFLIGSYLQLYESINKFPVVQAKGLKAVDGETS